MTVSIIIVNYHVRQELFSCILSIFDSKPKVNYEIIVVDNDENKTIKAHLHKKFPSVRYIANENKGFGQGNNIGVSQARGEYIFILNPDTKVYKNTVDILVSYLQKHKDVGIVAPVLFHADGSLFSLQGLGELTPFTAVFSLSFINKLLPRNPVSRKYWNLDWDKKSEKEVSAVPGTAFVIRKKLFEEVGGFDEHFFLYFEETDLCKRVSDMGLKLIMNPEAKIYHAWGSSTKKSKKNINKIFMQSRFYYFRKHFGYLLAILTEAILRTGRITVYLAAITTFGAFLRFFLLSKMMIFIGDQGWFYLSARNMLLKGTIPLVGIAASHPWLHQGPIWTYILVLLFLLFHFNPLAPGYFTAGVDTGTILMFYYITSYMFSRRVGVLAAFFYATSPLIIFKSRMPYHTSLIPLFTLILIFAVCRWVRGLIYYFSLAIFCLAVLYNFELSTVVLCGFLTSVFLYGLWKKAFWIKKLKESKVLLFSFLAFLLPMSPMLAYDSTHGFPQTVRFAVWIGYKTARLFGFPDIHKYPVPSSTGPFLSSSLLQLQRLVFLPNMWISIAIFLLAFAAFSFSFYRKYKSKNEIEAYMIVFLALLFSLGGYISLMTASGAYLPVFFPLIIIVLAVFFATLMERQKLFLVSISVVVLIGCANVFFLLKGNYFVEENTPTFFDKMSAAKRIVEAADNVEYNLLWNGQNREIASLTMNYEYLTWWLGHGPTNKPVKTQICINEDNGKVIITKKEK